MESDDESNAGISPDVCVKCNSEIRLDLDENLKIQCPICDRYYHHSCLKLSESFSRKASFINANWTYCCDLCIPERKSYYDYVKQIESMSSVLKNVNEIVNKLEMEVKSLKSKLDDNIAEKRIENRPTLKRRFAQVLQGASDMQVSKTPKRSEYSRSIAGESAALEFINMNKTPVVVISSKNDEERSELQINEIRDKVKKVLNPAVDPVQAVRVTARGKIIVQCNDEESVNVIKTKLVSNVSDNYLVDTPNEVLPMAKIVGLSDDETKESLEQKLRRQNPSVCLDESVLKIVQVYSSKHSYCATLTHT